MIYHTDGYNKRITRYLLLILLLGTGIWFTLYLESAHVDEVFFSGDGGLKSLMVRQFANDIWQPDLQIKTAPWLKQLWDQGLYPFSPPFVYKIKDQYYIQYPLFFPALSSPFYKLFGFRGLYVLPLVGTWGLWLMFLLVCRRSRINFPSTFVGLTGLIFASSLTIYSAIFSAHTLAVFMSFTGLTLAMPPKQSKHASWNIPVAGLLLGFAGWLRPESWIFIVATAAALWWIGFNFSKLTKLGLFILIPAAGFICFNLWLYNSPLGLHAVQSVDTSQTYYSHMSPLEILIRLSDKLIYCHPVILGLAGLALIGALTKQIGHKIGGTPDRNETGAWILIFIMMLVSAFLLPRDGGKQWGPRYWSHLLPLLWFIAAVRFNALSMTKGQMARLMKLILVLLMAMGLWLNTINGKKWLSYDLRERTLPALELVRHLDVDLIAVSHQWIAQELAAEIRDTPFVCVRNQSDFKLVVRQMTKAHLSKILWFGYHRKPKQINRYNNNICLQFGSSERIGRRYFVSAGLIASCDSLANPDKKKQ